jgi:16S rRNA C967 or C1407 C5-methylase (RsmB/RsmF family)
VFESNSAKLIIDGEEVGLPQPIPWYPDGLAWQMTISKKQLRKVPALKKLHNFMMLCEAGGHTTRQEAVSMVPPLFLDIEPHHAVIDMCAAPGSKTTQILDMMNAPVDAQSRGFVVANDVNRSRCFTLAHHIGRMAFDNCLIACHSAECSRC